MTRNPKIFCSNFECEMSQPWKEDRTKRVCLLSENLMIDLDESGKCKNFEDHKTENYKMPF